MSESTTEAEENSPPPEREPGARTAPEVRAGTFWAASLLVSLIVLVLLLLVWYTARTKPTDSNQLTSAAAVQCQVPDPTDERPVECAIEDGICRPVVPPFEATPECTVSGVSELTPTGRIKSEPGNAPVRLPTGVFIQTLEFRSGENVQMTGYVWQRVAGAADAFDGDARSHPEAEQERWHAVHDDSLEPIIDPRTGSQAIVELGVVLPEQFDTQFEMRRDYEWYESGAKQWTIGYYFEATVRQLFDYDKYPFDSEQVWLRMWPRSLSADVILVPDLASYPCAKDGGSCTGETDVFGVENSIALGGFKIEDTFFDYYYARTPPPETESDEAKRPPGYGTNLGLTGFEQNNYPELRFNFELKRELGQPLIGNLVPFTVAASLVFAILMTVTANARGREELNLDTAITMLMLVGMFTAVLIVHIQLRTLFDTLVYFESFYYLLYLAILGVALNNLLISVPATSGWKLFTFGDNLIPKILYWPTLLVVALIVSAEWLDVWNFW